MGDRGTVKKAEILFQLQEIDSALDRAALQLAQCRARLGDESELVPLRSALETARRQLRALQSDTRDLELTLETATSKLMVDEKKLYGGTIKSPKELSSLAHEVEMERQRVGRLEERVLVNMDAIEAASKAAGEANRIYVDMERAWAAEQSRLHEECASLQRQVDALSSRRASVTAEVDGATLRTYEGLRRTRAGLAVAVVEQRACKGCRINLSSSEVQRARSSPDLVFCQSCGRILFAGS
jgi:uncharacterized protein